MLEKPFLGGFVVVGCHQQTGIGADPLRSDRAEPLTLGPQRVDRSVERGLDLVRASIGGQVEIEVITDGVGRITAHQEIAD